MPQIDEALPRRNVAAALIFDGQGRLLICQRGAGGSCAFLYEFPGGKQEAGETLQDCLRRECREELGFVPQVLDELYQTRLLYPEIDVRLHFFHCRLPEGASVQCLVHRHLAWVRPCELKDYTFCPADTELIVRLQSGEFWPESAFH